jgi:2',3'-cyclic-nucleotide 2'-phosphodiesterase
MKKGLKLLFIGDLVGDPGIALFQKWIPRLKEKYNADAVIVNGENAAKNGNGITPQNVEALKKHAAVITTGNHAWDQKAIYQTFQERNDLLRPINYPSECPGKGYTFFEIDNVTVAVINLHGRVFIKDLLDCPFKAIESLLLFVRHRTNIIFVDFHAEATSEKKAMGFFLDGKISGIYGTHTHVQTADEQVLPLGTSYITDLGCCGALNSVIGMQYEGALKKFMVHHKFGKFVVEHRGPMVFCGVLVEVDTETGKTVKIERIRIIDNEISQNFEDTTQQTE